MSTPTTSPLARQPHEEKITYALSVLQVSVKNFGLIGLVGINTVSEPFFRDFLNTVYGLNLSNLNNGIANYPAIDLGDTGARLCFQVSSDGTKRKLQKTLKTFGDPKHNLLHSYDTLRVMVIGKRQKTYNNLTIPQGVTFNPATDVIDVPMLIATLPNTATSTLISLSQIIDQEMPMFASATMVQRHTDAKALDTYRSYFLRRALLDPWQQEGNIADFRDAIDSLLGLLTTGYVQGQPIGCNRPSSPNLGKPGKVGKSFCVMQHPKTLETPCFRQDIPGESQTSSSFIKTWGQWFVKHCPSAPSPQPQMP